MPQRDLLKVRFAGIVGKSPDKHETARRQAAEELDTLLWKAARSLQESGVNVIGALATQEEEDKGATGRERKALNLQILPTGQVVNIFSAHAQIGCRLNGDAFQAVVDTVYSLATQIPENDKAGIFLNRFGKEETEGSGYSKVLELALDRNIPVIVGIGNGVSRKNGHDFREAWRKYIEGTTGVSLESYPEIMQWCTRNNIMTRANGMPTPG